MRGWGRWGSPLGGPFAPGPPSVPQAILWPVPFLTTQAKSQAWHTAGAQQVLTACLQIPLPLGSRCCYFRGCGDPISTPASPALRQPPMHRAPAQHSTWHTGTGLPELGKSLGILDPPGPALRGHRLEVHQAFPGTMLSSHSHTSLPAGLSYLVLGLATRLAFISGAFINVRQAKADEHMYTGTTLLVPGTRSPG